MAETYFHPFGGSLVFLYAFRKNQESNSWRASTTKGLWKSSGTWRMKHNSLSSRIWAPILSAKRVWFAEKKTWWNESQDVATRRYPQCRFFFLRIYTDIYKEVSGHFEGSVECFMKTDQFSVFCCAILCSLQIFEASFSVHLNVFMIWISTTLDNFPLPGTSSKLTQKLLIEQHFQSGTSGLNIHRIHRRARDIRAPN